MLAADLSSFRAFAPGKPGRAYVALGLSSRYHLGRYAFLEGIYQYGNHPPAGRGAGPWRSQLAFGGGLSLPLNPSGSLRLEGDLKRHGDLYRFQNRYLSSFVGLSWYFGR
jgi:hypothetical protein